MEKKGNKKIITIVIIAIILVVFAILMGFNKAFVKFRTQIYLKKYNSTFSIVNIGTFDESGLGGNKGLSLTIYDKKNKIDFTITYKKGLFGYYKVLDDTYNLYKGEVDNEDKVKDIIESYVDNYSIYLNNIDGEGTLNYFIYVSNQNNDIDKFLNKINKIIKDEDVKMRCTVVVIDNDDLYNEYNEAGLFTNYGLAENDKYTVGINIKDSEGYDKVIHSYSYSIADETTLDYGVNKIGE